jgi:hypothetical protein
MSGQLSFIINNIFNSYKPDERKIQTERVAELLTTIDMHHAVYISD